MDTFHFSSYETNSPFDRTFNMLRMLQLQDTFREMSYKIGSEYDEWEWEWHTFLHLVDQNAGSVETLTVINYTSFERNASKYDLSSLGTLPHLRKLHLDAINLETLNLGGSLLLHTLEVKFWRFGDDSSLEFFDQLRNIPTLRTLIISSFSASASNTTKQELILSKIVELMHEDSILKIRHSSNLFLNNENVERFFRRLADRRVRNVQFNMNYIQPRFDSWAVHLAQNDVAAHEIVRNWTVNDDVLPT